MAATDQRELAEPGAMNRRAGSGTQDSAGLGAEEGGPARAGLRGGPLRVAAYVERFLRPEQGFVYRQMTGLAGCEVRFFCRWLLPDGTYSTEHVTPAAVGPPLEEGRLGRMLRRLRQRVTGQYTWLGRVESRELANAVTEFKPDVIHAHWGPDAMQVAESRRLANVPLLVHFHGYDVSWLAADQAYRSSLPSLFRRMRLALTVSDEMRSRAVNLGCPADRVVTHRTGVPEEYFAGARIPRRSGEPFRVLQVGRLIPCKGHDLALRAFQLLARELPEAHLQIAGSGPLLAALRAVTAELGLGGRVEFLGWQPPGAVASLMRNAHALLVPSQTRGDIEGIPNAAVEGLAAGVPVVATRHGGIPEAVDYGDSSWLVPEGDHHSLLERLRTLTADLARWQQISLAGQARARAHFHLPTQNARLVLLYRRLLGLVE